MTRQRSKSNYRYFRLEKNFGNPVSSSSERCHEPELGDSLEMPRDNDETKGFVAITFFCKFTFTFESLNSFYFHLHGFDVLILFVVV